MAHVQLKWVAILISVLLFSNKLIPTNQPDKIKEGFYLVNDYGRLSLNYKDKLYHLEDAPFCQVSYIKSSSIQPIKGTAGMFDLSMVMDEKGTAAFDKATDVFPDQTKQIALVIGNKIVSLARISSHIINGKVAIANTSEKELQRIQSLLK